MMAMQRRMRSTRHYEQEGASMRDWLLHVGGVIRESGTVAGILCRSASRSPLHWWDCGASPASVFRCHFRACCLCRVVEGLAVELNCVAKNV